MGFQDRDYYRTPASPGDESQVGRLGGTSVTTWLIVINVAVYLLNGMILGVVTDPAGRPVARYALLWELGHFSVGTAIFGGQIWRFITFQFLHAGFWHLLMNMLGLYFFGPLIEYYLGSRRFLLFYLLCGVAGPFGYMLLWAASGVTPQALQMTAYVPLVGASAGVFGILMAAATIAPDATVLVYGVLPMRLRVMAWVLLGIAVWTVFTAGRNAGGEAAHLGGAVLGWLLIRNPQVLNVVDPAARRRRRFMT